MGDRYFDLGNLSINNGFDRGRRRARCWRPTGTSRARPAASRPLRLMRSMSDVREALWGVVQGAISDLDFDFAAYAERALRRLAADGRRPPIREWLRDAAAP